MTKAEKKQLKHILALELKMEHILDYTQKKILELILDNQSSIHLSLEKASYNVGAIENLKKVVELLKKDSKEFFE